MAGFKGFTLRWYQQLFSSGLYLDSVWTSMKLAAATGIITVVLSAAAAFAVVRRNFPGKGALLMFWMFPISLPQIAIGIGMLRLLQDFTLLPPFVGLLAVHVTITLPFCIGLLRASVQQLDRSQEDAASSLGAGTAAAVVPGDHSGAGAGFGGGRHCGNADELRGGNDHELPHHRAHDDTAGAHLCRGHLQPGADRVLYFDPDDRLHYRCNASDGTAGAAGSRFLTVTSWP